MKRAKRINVFLVLFSLAGLVSCSTDDNSMVYPDKPVEVKDVEGSYKAQVITVQGRIMNEANTAFVVKDSVMSFESLPVREIVSAIVKDKKELDKTIHELGKVKYEVEFTAKLNETKTIVELTLTPKPLELNVPVDGVDKKVIATFTAEKKGIYKSNRVDFLRFEFNANRLSIDGTDLSTFETVKYSFPLAVKQQ